MSREVAWPSAVGGGKKKFAAKERPLFLQAQAQKGGVGWLGDNGRNALALTMELPRAKIRRTQGKAGLGKATNKRCDLLD